MPEAVAQSPPSFWKAAVLGFALFAGSGTLLFHTGLYGLVSKPDSSAGWLARRRFADEWFGPQPARAVAVFGDSRIGEGLAPDLAEPELAATRTAVRSVAVPGSSLRVQALLLERLDPRGGRWPVVVVALASYDDWDEPDDPADRSLDVPFLAALLGPTALLDAVPTFRSWANKKELALSLLFPWYGQRRDLQDFARSPWERYREVRALYGSYRWGRPYAGRDGNVVGARLEGDTITGLPPDADPRTAPQLRAVVLAAPPSKDGRMTDYRQQWLSRIVAHEAGKGTLVVFLRMPTQVLPALYPRPPSMAVLDALAHQPHVRVLPRELFAELERPEFFRDGLHLNRTGRQRFTALFAAALRPLCTQSGR